MHGMVDATEEKFGEVNDAVKAVEDKVTALEENGTGGDVAYVYVPFGNQLSDVQIEENKKSYVKILNGADLKVNIMGSICNAEFSRIESGAITFGVVAHATAENSSGARIYHEYLLCILSKDGTVIVDATDDNNTPAPSGPLRVWMYQNDMSELTQQQVDDNIATYNAIASGDITPVLVCVKFEDDSLLSVSTYHATSDYVAYSNGQKFVTVTIYGVNADLLVAAVSIELNADGTITME
jgi:hypothetical protein